MINKRKYKKKIIPIGEKSTPKLRADRLRKLRGLANLTREDMPSYNSGITLFSIRSWENSRFGGLPLDGAEKVIRRVTREGVKCSLEWLIHGIGAPPEGTVLEKSLDEEEQENQEIAAQIEEEQKELLDNESLLIAEELAFFNKQFKKTLDFKVEDDGLAPLYKPGEYVAGIERLKKNFSTLAGLDCIVFIEGNKTYLRRFELGSTKDRFTLRCTNPNTSVTQPTLYDVKVLRAAPVIRHYQKDPEKATERMVDDKSVEIAPKRAFNQESNTILADNIETNIGQP